MGAAWRPVLLVSAICASIAGALVFVTARRKCGNSSLHVEELLVRIGHPFRGQVETGLRAAPADGFWLALRATEPVADPDVPGDVVLWEDYLLERREDLVTEPQGIGIPFIFDIPGDAKPSTGDERWVLDVTAPRFGARFPLPVTGS